MVSSPLRKALSMTRPRPTPETDKSQPSPFSRRRFLGMTGAALAAGAAAPLLAACGDDSGSAAKPTSNTLTIMTTGVPADEQLAMWKQYAAEPLGVELKFVTVADGTFPSQALAAQQSNNPPDIIQWSSQGAPVLKASGIALEPLDSYISSSETKSDFYPQDYASGTIDDKVYALGFNCDSRAIAYRGDWAAAAGPVPTNWDADEFGAWAAKLKGPNRTAFGWEAKTADGRGSSNFLPLLWSTGASLVTKQDGKWATGFTESQFASVLDFYAKMVNTYKATPKHVAGWGYPDTDGGFSKGTLGAYSVGPWITAICKDFPDVLKNIKCAPIPNLGTPTSFWSESALMLHSGSANKDKAWQFIANMRSEKAQDAMTAMKGNTEGSPRISSNDKLADPLVKQWAAQLEFAKVPEPIDIHVVMDGVVYPAMQEVALKGTAPAEVAKTAMKNMETALTQLNV
jgi:ABC-type glycerol-3-phosphate transport system substrate-binding protein